MPFLRESGRYQAKVRFEQESYTLGTFDTWAQALEVENIFREKMGVPKREVKA